MHIGKHDAAAVLAMLSTVLAVVPALATANEWEEPPVLRAEAVLPAALLKSAQHSVAEKVVNDGFMNTYTLRTPFGDMSVRSTIMLRLRANEAEAIAKIKALEESEELKEAMSDSVNDVAEGFKRIAQDPGGAAKGAASGVRKMFNLAGEAWRSRDTQETGVGDLAKTVTGYSKLKRELAGEVGVDPYSSNAALQAELDRVATAATQGGLAVTFAKMLVPGGLGLMVGAAGWTQSLNELVITSSPTELRIINRDKLHAMGVDPDIAELFIDNPAFTPTYQTYLAGALEQIAAAQGRQEFVKYAIPTTEEEVALFRTRAAQIYAGYHRDVGPIARFISRGKMVAAVTGDGKLLLAAPVDYLAWTQPLDGFVALFEGPLDQGEGPSARELWITGAASGRTREEMRKRGWTIKEGITL